jgi:hypothetical protein
MPEAELYSPDGVRTATIPIGGYSYFEHFFDIRYAPDLLFLRGRGRGKTVVAVDVPGGRMRQLFPHEWDARGRELTSGVGAYFEDRSGPAIVHTGEVQDGRSWLPRESFVVRRAYPNGEQQWVIMADPQATALDIGDGLVYVAFDTGELMVLRADDGAVLARHELSVGGHRVLPLSLVRSAPGRLAIGTLDGRVLDCSVTVRPPTSDAGTHTRHE